MGSLIDADQEGQGQENYVKHVLEVAMKLCPGEPKGQFVVRWTGLDVHREIGTR